MKPVLDVAVGGRWSVAASRVMCEDLRRKVVKLKQKHDGAGEQTSGVQPERSPGGGAGVLSRTLEALQAGQVVALPTDTLYGLACLAQRSDAVSAVYDIKGRDAAKPLAICLGAVQDVFRFCKVRVERDLLTELLPGPVTLVLERSEELNPDLNPFTPLVGVRIPDHAFMRRLCQACGEPLALTSANVSTHGSTVAVHEFQALWPSLGLVVDGGAIGDQSRLGSTVVDLSVPGRYRVIRPGCALSATVGVLERKGLREDSARE